MLKTSSKITQILTILASVAALVFFFLAFATVTSNGQTITLTASQLAFKGKVVVGEEMVKMARSTDLWFCMLLTIIGVGFSALTFKFKGMRYASAGVNLGAGIYMLVVALSRPASFIDTRPLTNITALSYAFSVWAIPIALLVAAAFAIAYLLLSDRVMVAESKGKKLTIPQRVVRFFKDYKSEVRKIVWPSRKTVFKNTLVVIVICLLLGGFIWLLDWGLASLLKVIFK